jgi:ABC-type uncharacterized transport system involved in gliding motility auxiliary subunit
MKPRQTKNAAIAGTYLIVVLAVLVVANFLANRYNKSYDSTANKRFSLSEQTAKIVKDLKQDVNITYFDKPRNYASGTPVKDLLDRYSNLSPKVHVSYVDPDLKPQLARLAGVKNYGTTVVDIGTKHEEAKGMTEEGITGAMIRDMKSGARMVCLVTGSGEHQIDDSDKSGYSSLKTALAKDNFESKSVDLLTKAQVPSDCTALIVAGPTKDYAQPEVDALKAYVESGGRAMFMLDPPLKIGRSDIADNDALVALLASWGVTPVKDLILDLNPIGQLNGLGPQIPLVMQYESHPIVSELKRTATAFPLARSLEIKNTEKTTVQKLFGSSGDSFATTNLASPEVKEDPAHDKKGPLTMAAAGTYNTGKENSQGRFVVIGNSSWAANSFLSFNGNSDLMLNSVDWLASDEALISIRPKETEDRRLNLNRSQFALLRFVSQFALPLIVIVGGVAVWWRRR